MVSSCRVHPHINQREARSLADRLHGNEVLVPSVPTFNSTEPNCRRSCTIPARQVVPCYRCSRSRAPVPPAVALDGLAVFLQLFVVVADDFVGCVVGEKFRATTFSENPAATDLRWRSFCRRCRLSERVGAGIQRQPCVANIGLLLTCKSPRGDLMSTCFSPSALLSFASMLQAGSTHKAASSRTQGQLRKPSYAEHFAHRKKPPEPESI